MKVPLQLTIDGKGKTSRMYVSMLELRNSTLHSASGGKNTEKFNLNQNEENTFAKTLRNGRSIIYITHASWAQFKVIMHPHLASS